MTLGKRFCPIGQRHKMTAQTLRKTLEQHLNFFFDHAGHEPLQAHRIQLVQGIKRYGHRDAVTRRTRIKVVIQRHRDAGDLKLLREVFDRDAGCVMTHQVGLLKEQKFRILRFRLFSPLIKGLLIDNALTDFLVIKLVNHAVVHQHIRTTRLVFHLADVVDHGDVVLPERSLAFEFFFYQSSANKDLSRGFRILAGKIHLSFRVHWQTVQSALF